ncbi:hypothetical protein V1511DRAFT_505665 [Dipodascopsis uninucleata]
MSDAEEPQMEDDTRRNEEEQIEDDLTKHAEDAVNDEDDLSDGAVDGVNDGKLDDDDDEDELSELDEDQFKDIEVDQIGIPITEEVYKIQRHKRDKEIEGAEVSKRGPDGGKKRERSRRSRREPSEEIKQTKSRRSRKESSKKSNGGAAEEPENIENLDPDARRLRELEERIDLALKPQKKRKKLDEDDLEQMQDDRIIDIRERMRQAAIRDAEAIKDGIPATHKLSMLSEVRDVLQKHTLYDSILDNNLLESVRLWLEPLPDASLPAYSIQREMFSALEELPIKSTHLRESGIGKIVLFYHKSKRPQHGIKRIADKLVADWSRPIIGRKQRPMRSM